VAALKVHGFEVRIDRQDLPQLEDWERELLDFIRQADSVVLIVSPHSLASQVVEWELEQVRLNRKRLAPVMIAETTGPLRLDRSPRMRSACTTCSAMSGSGWRIAGTTCTRAPRRTDLPGGQHAPTTRFAWCTVGLGTTFRLRAAARYRGPTGIRSREWVSPWQDIGPITSLRRIVANTLCGGVLCEPATKHTPADTPSVP
jgi:hypothetical protein